MHLWCVENVHCLRCKFEMCSCNVETVAIFDEEDMDVEFIKYVTQPAEKKPKWLSKSWTVRKASIAGIVGWFTLSLAAFMIISKSSENSRWFKYNCDIYYLKLASGTQNWGKAFKVRVHTVSHHRLVLPKPYTFISALAYIVSYKTLKWLTGFDH